MRRSISFFLLLTALPVSQRLLAVQNGQPPKALQAIDCGSNSPSAKVKCPPTVEVAITTPKHLYENTRDAIVEVGQEQFGFPADILVAAFDLKHPSGTNDRSFVADLQAIKRFGASSSPESTLVSVDLPYLGGHLYPAELIRALFETELFPSTLEVTETWPIKSGPQDRALYIILDSKNAPDAKKALDELVNNPLTKNDSPFGVNRPSKVTAIAPYPRLTDASYSPRKSFAVLSDSVADQSPESSGLLAELKSLPHVTVGQFIVTMTIYDNRWYCDEWQKIVHTNGPDAVTDRLTQLGGQGCLLGLVIRVPRGLRVVRHISAYGKFSGPLVSRLRFSPKEFENKSEFSPGVSGSICGNGSVKWDLKNEAVRPVDGDATSYVEIAVPYFKPDKVRPDMVLGIAVETYGNEDPLDREGNNRGCIDSDRTYDDVCWNKLVN